VKNTQVASFVDWSEHGKFVFACYIMSPLVPSLFISSSHPPPSSTAVTHLMPFSLTFKPPRPTGPLSSIDKFFFCYYLFFNSSQTDPPHKGHLPCSPPLRKTRLLVTRKVAVLALHVVKVSHLFISTSPRADVFVMPRCRHPLALSHPPAFCRHRHLICGVALPPPDLLSI
jgi:hypothetical protein